MRIIKYVHRKLALRTMPSVSAAVSVSDLREPSRFLTNFRMDDFFFPVSLPLSSTASRWPWLVGAADRSRVFPKSAGAADQTDGLPISRLNWLPTENNNDGDSEHAVVDNYFFMKHSTQLWGGLTSVLE